MRTSCGRIIVAGAGLAVLGSGAWGAELFLAGQIGEVYVGDSHDGGFAFFGGVCLASTHALAFDDVAVYAGDVTGGILRLDAQTGELLDLYFVPGDATDLVVHRGDLLVSASGGDVHRVDPLSGAVKETMSAPIQIQAMALDDDDLYIAGTIGEVYKGSALDGGFQLWGGACLAPIQALAIDEANVYAGDVNGGVLAFDLATGEPANLYFLPEGITAMVREADELLVSSAPGTIRRVDAATGAVVDTMQSPIDVEALEIRFAAADLDQDGFVGILDLLALLGAWGQCPPPPQACPGDIDGNGLVGVGDLIALLSAWG